VKLTVATARTYVRRASVASVFDVVVAADLEWGIGKAGGLPWPKLRGDLAHFRRVTTSTAREGARNAIVMGRKTWESKEVGGKPLPKRLNVVVSRGELVVPEGVVAAKSLDEALAVKDVETIFVVGGAGLFQEALVDARLRYVYLTRVEGRFECDVTMPNLDERNYYRDATWDGEAIGEDNGVRYRIERLCRP
jgi:dihydrofolate reductase